jgi:hypothetical protein
MRNIGKKTWLAFVFLFALATSASGDLLNTNKFAKAVQFTASGCAVPAETPLANFPVLVRLSKTRPSNLDYSLLGGTTNEVYQNLRFADGSGNNLDYEIDTWNILGESLIWVSVPSLATNTIFTAYFSKANDYTLPSIDPRNVWTKANYVGVWHMSEASGTVADSSGHSLLLSPAGDAAADASVAGSGRVGNGRQCVTKGYLSIANADAMDVGSAFAVSGWFDMSPSQPSGDVRFFSRKEKGQSDSGWEVVRKSNNIAARGGSGDNIASYTPPPNFAEVGWKHLFVVYNGNTATIYEDGVEKSRATAGVAPTDNDNSLSIGSYSGGGSTTYFVGNVDECRLLGSVPSAEWAKAEYDNINSNAFLDVGEEQTLIVPTGLSALIGILPIGCTNATVQVEVLSLGNASSATITVDISEVPDFSPVIKTSQKSVTDIATVPFMFDGLTTNKTYYARATLNNQQDPLVTVEKSFKTNIPVAPTVMSAAFLSRTGSSLAATVVLSALGADVATVRLEASRDGFPSIVASSRDMAAIVGEPVELAVEKLDQLTFYDLRVVVQNEWGFGTVVEVGRFATRPTSGLLELYVDSSGSGNGSAPTNALPTIREALEIAGAGFTIWVRGGDDRGYSVATQGDLMVIPESDIALRSYGGEGPAKVEISATLKDSLANASVINIPVGLTNIVISGFAFTYYGSDGVDNAGSLGNSGRVIDVYGDYVTIEDCTFRQIGNYTKSNGNITYVASSESMGHAAVATRAKQNDTFKGCYMTVRRCRFLGESEDRSMSATIHGRNSVFSENVFSNCYVVTMPVKNCDTSVLFVSNVIYRCAGFKTNWDNWQEWPNAEFAYNIVFSDPGSGDVFIHKNGRHGLTGNKVLVHHNTIVNALSLAMVVENGTDNQGQIIHKSWQPQFFDNLILLDPTVADATVFKNDQTSFKEGNYSSFETGGVGCLKNNAWYAPGGISGGAATTVAGYDLSKGCAITNNIVLDAWPTFMSMDLDSPDFMRPRASRNPTWAIRGVAWTNAISGCKTGLCDYIGAVEPLMSSPLIINLR